MAVGGSADAPKAIAGRPATGATDSAAVRDTPGGINGVADREVLIEHLQRLAFGEAADYERRRRLRLAMQLREMQKSRVANPGVTHRSADDDCESAALQSSCRRDRRARTDHGSVYDPRGRPRKTARTGYGRR